MMVFPHLFILHGIRAIAEIIGMFSTDLRPEMKISNACNDPWKAFCICSSRPRTKWAGFVYEVLGKCLSILYCFT